MNGIVTLSVIFAGVLGTAATYGQGMPEELKNHIRDHMIGQWSAEGTRGDEKSQGEHRFRWASGRTCVIERITLSDKNGEPRQTNLWGWDPAAKAIVVYGFSSRGNHFAIHFNDLSNEKWAGHGKGTFEGKDWNSPASIEWKGDSLKYEDTTDGKPFVPCGQKSQPSRNSFSSYDLSHSETSGFSRQQRLTICQTRQHGEAFGLFGGADMNFILEPWQLLFVILASWINKQQQEVIDYLRTENQVLKEKLGTKRILLNDDQRRRLAVKGKVLGRKMLQEVGTLFTPDTILRWHRTLVAKKWDYSERRQQNFGRPRVNDEVTQLILKMARENPAWGYDRIQGALANLGHDISDQTVGNILKKHGIEPAPQRKRQTSWSTFLKAPWDVLGSIDFTTIEVWTKGGLVTFYLLFVMELKTRRVHFAGFTPTQMKLG